MQSDDAELGTGQPFAMQADGSSMPLPRTTDSPVPPFQTINPSEQNVAHAATASASADRVATSADTQNRHRLLAARLQEFRRSVSALAASLASLRRSVAARQSAQLKIMSALPQLLQSAELQHRSQLPGPSQNTATQPDPSAPANAAPSAK